ncbi:MAG: glycosyltransferase family 2 protein [Chloroflexota bacterium]|nr:glycosyltransferase family 2 protein [Chloroflexota bacterium]
MFVDMVDLGIVIVNFKTKDFLRDCLRSIFDSEGDFSFQVCVVDNASGDGSVEMVRDEFPQVHLIAQQENQGYAHANNLGLYHFGFRDEPGAEPAPDAPRFALLLNPDTLLPTNALEEMLTFVDARPTCGVAGPRLVRQDGSLDKACRRSFPSPATSFYRLTGLSSVFHTNPRFGRYNLSYVDDTISIEVDSVVGAFMMIRREALSDVGLLDESFFMYGEDLDLAYRIKAAGWKVWYDADVTVLHYKGESSKQRSWKSIVNFYDAMDTFHRKHYASHMPIPVNWIIRLAIWTLCGVNLIRNALRPRERRGVASAV